MPNPTRDEIKRLAQLVESAYETAAELGKKEVDCSVLSIKQAATLARAYLALREQVETVALPALQAGREAMRERRLYGDAWERKYDEKWNDEDAQVDSAIKVIEEGCA